MKKIESLSNQEIKETAKLAQKKFRNAQGLFLLEGYKPVFEAFREGVEIKTLYTTGQNLEKFSFLKDKITIVTEPVLEKISTTESMPEAVAVGVQKKHNINDLREKKRLVLIENIKDAGNLGTILRSAAAFGFEGVILAGDTIDIYNPKVVRSAVGGLFKIPVIKVNSVKDAVFQGYSYIASVVNRKNVKNPEEIDYSRPFVLMLGSEADGLSEEAIETADILTTIPISEKTESLNLSCAASILFYISSNLVSP